MSDLKAVGAQVGGEQKREPSLVTHITIDGKAERVKLVFDHLHFCPAEQRQVRAVMEASDLTPDRIMLTRKQIEAVTLPCRVSDPGFASAPFVEGPDTSEKRGRIVEMPVGLTIARVILWPTLEQAQQGDGSRSNLVIATGYSVCASMDNFKKSEGRHHALTDLLRHPALVGANKEKIAKCYAGRVRK